MPALRTRHSAALNRRQNTGKKAARPACIARGPFAPTAASLRGLKRSTTLAQLCPHEKLASEVDDLVTGSKTNVSCQDAEQIDKVGQAGARRVMGKERG